MAKYEDLVAEEDKRAAKNKMRDVQIKKDAEMMNKRYPEKKAGVFIIEEPEPTEKEKEMMRQQVRERKMDEGTARGAAQYESEARPFKKGGMVSKGNGCAIRGVKKCKIC